MNSLANEGFVILGGPLEGSPDGGGSLGEQGSTPHHPGRTLDAAARISRVHVTTRRILHVSKHQNAAQLHAAGHGRRDPGIVAAVRPETEWLHEAVQSKRGRFQPGGGRGGAGRTGAARCARDDHSASRSGRRSGESPREGGGSFSSSA